MWCTAPQHLVCRVVQSLHMNHMQMFIIEVSMCRRLHMNTSMINICIWLICRLCLSLLPPSQYLCPSFTHLFSIAYCHTCTWRWGVSVCLSVCDSCACVLYVHVQMLESNKMSCLYNCRVEKYCFTKLCMIPSLTGYESTCTVCAVYPMSNRIMIGRSSQE